jgi:hypothetical protein
VANTDLILKLNAEFHFPWDKNTWSLSTAPYAYIYNSYALNIWFEFYHGPFFFFKSLYAHILYGYKFMT